MVPGLYRRWTDGCKALQICLRRNGHLQDTGKSIKAAGSIRVVPVHPELIRLGFIEYHEGRVKDGGTALFAGAKRNERGQMMSDVSRSFGRYLSRIGLEGGAGPFDVFLPSRGR